MELIEYLRQKYPEPGKSVPGGGASTGTYCVGGALLRELGFRTIRVTGGSPRSKQMEQRGRTDLVQGHGGSVPLLDAKGEEIEVGQFPSPQILADGLCMANRLLTVAAALAFAKVITRKNDTGNFETAWGLLGDALAWTGVEWTDGDSAAMHKWAMEGECIG